MKRKETNITNNNKNNLNSCIHLRKFKFVKLNISKKYEYFL